VTTRKRYWLAGIAVFVTAALVTAIIAASILSKRFEPMLREQAISYLQERFHCEVQLAALHIHPPRLSTLDILLKRGRGALANVEGDGLEMRLAGERDLPPLFTVRKLQFTVDLGMLAEKHKKVEFVTLEGMQIYIPPKGARPGWVGSGNSTQDHPQSWDVLIKEVQIRDALLVLLPKDSNKQSLRFDISSVHLESVGVNSPMKYDGDLTIPKPPGTLHSQGAFGPWAAAEPGDTPLNGAYKFEHADLGVFNAIAGTLTSTGTFDGTLDAVEARGQASVPNFSLKSVGQPVPLVTHFEVLVDGTNGDTVLRPVRARLGNTNFTTTGAVIKHEKQAHRSIALKVLMPAGDMRDLLRLAIQGSPFMEGRINLRAKIQIPPLNSTVKEKLILDGDFNLQDAKFLRSTIQSQIDQMSRRGQGEPKNEQIDEVASNMNGSFRLENEVMTFRSLSFEVPGAAVAISGDYNLGSDVVDFHGTLALDAKLSQTMTGWKRWALKPADRFFAKNGVGALLHIKIDGSSHQPKFGLDHGHGSSGESGTGERSSSSGSNDSRAK
jgi:AsmA-like protein